MLTINSTLPWYFDRSTSLPSSDLVLNCSTGGTSFDWFSAADKVVCVKNVKPITIAHNCRDIIFAPADTGGIICHLHGVSLYTKRGRKQTNRAGNRRQTVSDSRRNLLHLTEPTERPASLRFSRVLATALEGPLRWQNLPKARQKSAS